MEKNSLCCLRTLHTKNLDILFQNNKSCQNHQWSKKYANAFAVPTRLAESPSASTSGTPARPTNWPICSAIPAAGHGAPPSSSTARWETSEKPCRVALSASNTVFLDAPSTASAAATASITASRLPSSPATPASRDTPTSPKTRSSWQTKSSKLWAWKPATSLSSQ